MRKYITLADMEFAFDITQTGIASICLLLIVLRNMLEVKRCTTRNSAPSISIFFALTTLILFLPFLIVLLIICTLCQKLMTLILKIKFGCKFGGLLKGADAFHMVDDPSHSIIHCLMFVKCITNREPEEFFKCIQTLVWKLHQHSKFKMIFIKSLGYSFMLNGNLSVDDCIKKMKTMNCPKTILEKEELLVLLNEYCNAPLLKNQRFSWDVIVGTQSVNWNNDEYKYYPLLFRINHTVADGVTLIKLMLGLADKEDINVESTELCNSSTTVNSNKNYYNDKHCIYKNTIHILLTCVSSLWKNVFNRFQRLFRLCLASFYVLLLLPASLVVTFICKAKDQNILHGPSLSGQKFLALSIDKSQEYFLKTKRIKNRVPGTTFSSVLITAFSASLADYFQKNTAYPPQYITATIPVHSGSLDIQHSCPGNVNLKTTKVSNGYSFLLMNLPILITESPTEKNMKLLRRLTLINRESSILRNSSEYLVNYFLMSYVCSILPLPVVKFILNRAHCSTIISILPSPPNVTYCNGSMCISDVVSWAPHLHNIGTTFLINTHDNRLHMGLSIDKALVANKDIAQQIIDGVYYHLDLLEDEVNSVYPDTTH